jgi:hypothetical protein
VLNILTSPNRTFVLYAQTDRGLMVTRDGGMSWRTASAGETAKFPAQNFKEWQGKGNVLVRVNDKGELLRTTDGGQDCHASHAGVAYPPGHVDLLVVAGMDCQWSGWLLPEPGCSEMDGNDALERSRNRGCGLSPCLLDGPLLWVPSRGCQVSVRDLMVPPVVTAAFSQQRMRCDEQSLRTTDGCADVAGVMSCKSEPFWPESEMGTAVP